MDFSKNTEIRYLPNQNISEIGYILEAASAWKDVMGRIPGKPWVPGDTFPEGEEYPRKYTSEHISLVQHECLKGERSGFEILLEEWGTSGIKRPTFGDLFSLFKYSWQHRAAGNVMNLIDDESENINDEMESESLNDKMESENSNDEMENLNDELSEGLRRPDHLISNFLTQGVLHIPYNTIASSTADFEETPIEKGGFMVGRGATSVVFKGHFLSEGQEKTAAIKKFLTNDEKTNKQFTTEIEILSRCSHKNILELEGYSSNGPHLCLLYSFMSNGSLQDRLACLGDTEPLSWTTRMDVAEQIAEGIVYLHCSLSEPIVHRDIKSANILLDENFVPKIGDFGIVRFGSIVTTTAYGTTHYMAPEAFQGDISVKLDTFSYAIVLLELLTGLKAYDAERKEVGLLTLVTEEDDCLCLLDPKLDSLDMEVARNLFRLTEDGILAKKRRPTMEQTLLFLRSIISTQNTDAMYSEGEIALGNKGVPS